MRGPGTPSLVEVLGVAGSGKSTLATRLCDEIPTAVRAPFIQTRDPRHLATLLGAIPEAWPVLVRNLGPGPRMSWPDLKLLAYATRWHRVLERTAGRGDITVLDQGPLYALVRLRAQDRRVGRTAAFESWWEASLTRWARRLGVVVALDADDEVLLERINRREQSHATKGRPAEDARAFLARYRALFAETLQRLERPDGPTVLRFDTGATPGEEIVERLRPLLAGDAPRREIREVSR